MKFFVQLFTLTLLAAAAAAQTFQWQHPTPSGNHHNDAIILPSGTWILVSNGGSVVRSTDFGSSWTVTYPETTASDIYEATFVDDNTGFFCTTNGTIMKTTDGGVTWEYLNSGSGAQLWYVDFVNADTGLVVGASSTILRTTNGGANWTPFNLATSTLLYKVHYVNPATAYIGTASATVGRLLRTTDHGQTWNNVAGYTGTGTTRGIFFLNQDTGWVSNSLYEIYKTTNGGTSFALQASLGSGSLYEVKFINAHNGAAVGASGQVFTTTNGGTSWIPNNIGYNANVFGLGMTGVLGRTGDPTLLVGGVGGAIASSTDWGTTWTGHTQALIRQELRDVQFVNAQVGYAVGGSFTVADSLGVIMKTTDGGATWTMLPFNPQHRVYSTYWVDADTGYITSRGPTGIWKTTNGGQSFTQQNLGIGLESSIWYGVRFLNPQLGYVVGSSGFLVKTTNGGATWGQQNSGHGNSAIYSVYIIDEQNAITVGGSGRVFRTTNGGDLWSSITIGGTTTVYSAWWQTPTTGYVSGSGGVIRKTTNAGATWTPQTIGTTGTLYRIVFTDSLNGWVSGSLGTVFRTTDGGENWTRATRIVATDKTLFGLDVTAGHVHAVGTDATIIHADLSPVSVPQAGGTLPERFSLEQNYPNPFNPTTTITFTIPVGTYGHTSLRVYDLLGREVATLVNEVKQSGTHQVPWEAGDIASGVYFYRLETANFVATRKMLLIR